jgi:adenosylhomocysteine nucleosidase
LKILIVEDDGDKLDKIETLIGSQIDPSEFEIECCSTINDSLIRLGDARFDLVIVDLVLPQMKGAEPADATLQWCEQIENHLSGRTASWIVMTGFPDIAASARQSFAQHNVAVIQYDDSGNWESLLLAKLRETYETRSLDFLIVCALEKERRGYRFSEGRMHDQEIVMGLDCQRLQLGDFRGIIVVLPGPGMITAAIATTKAVGLFRPRAVAMSGICGGVEKETELGALIVPDLSWNYQAGKFVEGKLTPDLLQVRVPPQSRTTLAQLATAETSKSLRDGLLHSELENAPIQLQPMVTGSQVVADGDVVTSIGTQGRKVAAIDMEVASVLFAADDFFNGGGIFFAAKTVVDLANPHKDDRYHEYGCALSARFTALALNKLLSDSSGE